MKADVANPVSPQRSGLLTADLFAKAAAPLDLVESANEKPFLLVVDGPDFDEQRWFSSSEEHEFVKQLCLLDVLSRDGPNFWVDIDLSALKEEQYDELSRILMLHNVTKRDCIVEDTTVTDTKVAIFDHYLFIIVDTLLELEDDTWSTRNLNILLYKRACVTIHNGPIPGPASIFHRIQKFHNGRIPSADWVLYSAFDVLNESLQKKIDVTVKKVDVIDQKSVPDDISPFDLRNGDDGLEEKTNRNMLLRDMRINRKRLGKLRSSLSSKMETLEYLLQRSAATSPSSSHSRAFSLLHHL